MIIDGLDSITTTSSVAPGPPKLSNGIAIHIWGFLKQLYDACKSGGTGSMIVLARRLAPLQPGVELDRSGGPLSGADSWLYTAFKPSRSATGQLTPSRSLMELQGLSLADSIELCTETLHRAGETMPDVCERGTRDCLEMLIRLLLGIPGAITFFLLDGRENKAPVTALRGQLLSGETPIYQALLSNMHAAPIFDEFRCLPQELNSEQFSVMLMLGLFWHQGPYDIWFAEAMVEFEVCRTREVVNTVHDFAAERRYIQLVPADNCRRICFLHPSFTIYCRAFLEHLCRHVPLSHATRQTSAVV